MTEQELANLLLVKYDGGTLDYSNHEEDNSVVCCKDASEFVKYLQDHELQFVGISNDYTYRRERRTDSALVFKDKDDNVIWVHAYCWTPFRWMKAELEKSMNGEDAYRIANKCFREFYGIGGRGMKSNIEIKWGANGFAYLFVDGRLVYKSKNLNKVNASYEQMMKIQDNRERRIEQFRDNPYGMGR